MNVISYNTEIILDGIPEAAVSFGFGIVTLLAFLALIGIAERILFAIAAYFDARSKCNKDAVMWAFLIGFLGLIPGIIYLCIRNSQRNIVFCPCCGFNHLGSDMNCPKCGAPNQSAGQYINPLASQHAHRAKVLLTIALILIGVGFLSAIFIFFFIGANIINFTNGIY